VAGRLSGGTREWTARSTSKPDGKKKESFCERREAKAKPAKAPSLTASSEARRGGEAPPELPQKGRKRNKERQASGGERYPLLYKKTGKKRSFKSPLGNKLENIRTTSAERKRILREMSIPSKI